MPWLWRRRYREQDSDRELRAHLESETAEQQEGCLSLEEARYAAQRQLGNRTLLKEEMREVWTATWFDWLHETLDMLFVFFVRRLASP